MSTNVNDAVTTWNQEHAAATTDLVTLEVNLKTAYNAYIDALTAYMARIKAANEVRNVYFGTLQIEDVSNDTRTAPQFVYAAKLPIENNGCKYLLDQSAQSAVTRSATLVGSCNSTELLARKA